MMRWPRLLIVAHIARLAFCCLMLNLGGCKAMNPLSWFHSPKLSAPAGGGAGQQMTNSTLHAMAFMAFIPGLVLVVLSALPMLPLASVAKLGWTFILIGIGVALMPFVNEKFIGPAMIVGLILGTVLAGAWTYQRVALILRAKSIKAEYANNPDPKHLGAFAAIERQLDPRLDKAFKTGKADSSTIISRITA